MNLLRKYYADIKPITALFGVFILARIAFVWLMPATYSKDLYAWLDVIDVLVQGGNPYSQTGVLNWPPFWMQILYGVHEISKHTAISPIHVIQTVLITGEAMVVVVMYFILKSFLHQQAPLKVLVIAMALNPVSIFLCCQHCNFDIFVGFWVLLFVFSLLDFYETQSAASWLMACFFLGIGILTKTVPLVLLPVLVVGIQKEKTTIKLFGLLLVFTPVVIGMSIIFTLAHQGVTEHVLGYRSMPGWYGITGLLGLFGAYHVIGIYCTVSPVIILCLLLILTSVIYNIPSLKPKQLITLVLLLLLAMPTFGPGYSPPYINWFLPLIVLLYYISSAARKRFLILGYIIVACTYCVEYAFFNSHGAFMAKLIPTQNMLTLCDQLGSQHTQVLIRLPMFIYYVTLFILLIRDFSKDLPALKQQISR